MNLELTYIVYKKKFPKRPSRGRNRWAHSLFNDNTAGSVILWDGQEQDRHERSVQNGENQLKLITWFQILEKMDILIARSLR